MRIGVDGSKMPSAVRNGPIGSLDYGRELGLSFSTVISTGNEVDLGASDFFRHLVEDPDTGNKLFVDAQHFLNDGVGEEGNFGMSDGAVEHDARGAEVLAAMNDGDF